MARIARTFPSQGAPSTTRCIETVLRLHRIAARFHGQGAPSTTRCIETVLRLHRIAARFHGQGAPSTIRCIKTWRGSRCPGSRSGRVREHPAPSGALRRVVLIPRGVRRDPRVREHPAPSGALRPRTQARDCDDGARVREHPAPSGALRRGDKGAHPRGLVGVSGSTQHHQVRSIPCSRRAGRGPQSKCQGAEAGRCCGGASRGRAVSAPPVSFSAQ